MYVGRRISVLWFCLFRSHAWTNRNTDSLLISYHIPACQRAIFKEKNPLNNWAYAMMSQIYIALSFAMLNVLAYHSIGNEGELSNYQVQYNPILPLSIFIFTWINDTGAYCTGMLFGNIACLNEFLLKIMGRFHWRRSFQHYSCHCDGTLLPIHAD